jgi:hypothetical protein
VVVPGDLCNATPAHTNSPVHNLCLRYTSTCLRLRLTEPHQSVEYILCLCPLHTGIGRCHLCNAGMSQNTRTLISGATIAVRCTVAIQSCAECIQSGRSSGTHARPCLSDTGSAHGFVKPLAGSFPHNPATGLQFPNQATHLLAAAVYTSCNSTLMMYRAVGYIRIHILDDLR